MVLRQEGPAAGGQAHVAILLCTLQGQQYLRAQLESIVGQTHPSWTIWASDDGSRDDTQGILSEYQTTLGPARLSWRAGPGAGVVRNFLGLVCSGGIAADYYAYADQDDVWEPDKLERALAWLQTVPAHMPALYCARTRMIDANGKPVGLSELYRKPPGFANALVENIAAGNTMVFNHAARELLRSAGPDVAVAAHDWWTYLLVSGCGGSVFYDPQPALGYRQHGGNLVGEKSSIGRLVRARRVWQGRLRQWNQMNLDALRSVQQHLTPANQRRLAEFSTMRSGALWQRLISLRRSGVYRQSWRGNLGLLVAVMLNRI